MFLDEKYLMFVEIIITITTTMNMTMTYYQMIHSRNQEIFVFLST